MLGGAKRGGGKERTSNIESVFALRATPDRLFYINDELKRDSAVAEENKGGALANRKRTLLCLQFFLMKYDKFVIFVSHK